MDTPDLATEVHQRCLTGRVERILRRGLDEEPRLLARTAKHDAAGNERAGHDVALLRERHNFLA